MREANEEDERQFFHISQTLHFHLRRVCFSCSSFCYRRRIAKMRCGKLKKAEERKERAVVINERHKSQDFKWQLETRLPIAVHYTYRYNF